MKSKVWGSLLLLLCSVLLPVAAQDTNQDNVVIEQARGVDQRVDYASLVKLGPWDDRNYQMRKEDVDVIPANDRYVPGVPAFFKAQKRKEMAAQGFPLYEHYPRELNKDFQYRFGGLMRNGVIQPKGLGIYTHPDPKNPPPLRVFATDPLPKAVPIVGEGPFDGTNSDNETAVEYSPANPNVLVLGSNGTGGQRMVASTDGGVTFINAGSFPSSCCDPAMDWSPDGNIIYGATLGQQGGACGGSWCTQVYWSFNNGANWLGPVTVSTASSDKEYIHVDKHPGSPYFGRAYITWHQGNVMQFARMNAAPVNGGSPMTFHPAISFSAEERGIGSDLTTDHMGRVYYFWPTVTNASTEVRVLRSDDGGATFVDLDPGSAAQSAAVYDLWGDFDFAIPAMETRRAFIYVSADADLSGGPRNGRIYATFTDENQAAGSPGGGGGSAAATHGWIVVRYSDDQGATWQSATTPHPTGDQATVDRFHPWLDVDSVGNVHIAFYDTRNSGPGLRDKTDFYYYISMDGGATWIEETRVSAVTSPNITDGQEWGDYNGISTAAGNGTVGMTWTDNRGPQRSFLGRVTNIGAGPIYMMSTTPGAAEICAGSPLPPIDVTLTSFSGYTGTVTLSTPGLNATVFPSATFTVNPVVNPAAGGSHSTLNVTTSAGASSGVYPINVHATDAGGTPIQRDTTINVTVAGGAPAAATLVSPADAAVGVPTTATLTWDAIAGASGYLVEVATDAGFTSIVHTATITGTSRQVGGLAPNTPYYWRVRASNACGDGSYSAVRSFTTANEICFAGSLAIPDNNPAGVTSDLSGIAGTLTDLDVRIEATHTWVGDTKFTLTHGAVTRALIDRPGYTGSGFGCSANDIAVTADDEGPDGTIEAACNAAPPAVGGVRTPNETLAAFDGQDFSGTWTLTASDLAGGDNGNITRWCLLATLGAPANADLGVSMVGPVNPAAGSPVTYTLTISNAGPSDATGFSLADALPATLTGISASCAVTGTGNCGTNASAGQNVSFTGLALTAGGGNSLTITINATLDAGASGSLSNTATVTAGSPGDGAAANNTASQTTTVMPAGFIYADGFE
ncbi:MAG: DUF11 domain-containing protein [Xanthomonadales bacterium]|nr:DUF11 domain-containing protein [Xanthomonadales bacterium]